MTPPVTVAHAELLRERGLRVTRQRLAVIAALGRVPHAAADVVAAHVRGEVGAISTQAVYDVLNALTLRGIIRRIQPAGSTARYELRVGDNHHHAVCRGCGAVTDIDCAVEAAPCLSTVDLPTHAPGFVVDEAEVTFWGVCGACAPADQDTDDRAGPAPPG